MNLFKVNSKIIILALVLIAAGVVLALVSYSSLHFDVSALVNHGGTWYAPIKWDMGY
ncbi:hypothetical protein CPR19088_GLDEOEPO_01221 [Companilactobacillus paralimentarius]